METASAARAGRRKNLSLRLAPRARRQKESFDSAFESFYRERVAEVYQYALAVLGNSADAEDVTQQTFLNAYRAFERGEQPRKAHNWLIKIAHNVCRMRWRQSGRRPQEVPLESAGEPASREDDTPSLEEVLTALARIPFNQRGAIVMREVEGRSYAEIAEVLGTTVPAVEALLFRARTNLRARRDALSGALGIAPVPAGLASFFGGGTSGLAGGGGPGAPRGEPGWGQRGQQARPPGAGPADRAAGPAPAGRRDHAGRERYRDRSARAAAAAAAAAPTDQALGRPGLSKQERLQI